MNSGCPRKPGKKALKVSKCNPKGEVVKFLFKNRIYQNKQKKREERYINHMSATSVHGTSRMRNTAVPGTTEDI